MHIQHVALSPEWNWACESWYDFNLQKNLIDDTIFLNYLRTCTNFGSFKGIRKKLNYHSNLFNGFYIDIGTHSVFSSELVFWDIAKFKQVRVSKFLWFLLWSSEHTGIPWNLCRLFEKEFILLKSVSWLSYLLVCLFSYFFKSIVPFEDSFGLKVCFGLLKYFTARADILEIWNLAFPKI